MTDTQPRASTTASALAYTGLAFALLSSALAFYTRATPSWGLPVTAIAFAVAAIVVARVQRTPGQLPAVIALAIAAVALGIAGIAAAT